MDLCFGCKLPSICLLAFLFLFSSLRLSLSLSLTESSHISFRVTAPSPKNTACFCVLNIFPSEFYTHWRPTSCTTKKLSHKTCFCTPLAALALIHESNLLWHHPVCAPVCWSNQFLQQPDSLIHSRASFTTAKWSLCRPALAFTPIRISKKNFSRLDYGSRTMTPPCISRLAEWYWEAPVSNQKVGCFESKCIALSISAPAAFRHRFSASVQTAEWQVLRHAETGWDL